MKILVINAGSSSVKFTLFDMDKDVWLAKGMLERIRTAGAVLKYSNHRGEKFEKSIVANSYEAAISAACLALCDADHGVIANLEEIKGIGHRVVHGGAEISGAMQITPAIKQTILSCYELAPLHNPPNYEGIEACEYLFRDIPMVAVFDTAFHQTMPAAAYTYAIPAAVAAQYKIRRYGFHGTSHHYVALAGAKVLGKEVTDVKLITAHLGNGCSITAINKGQVADTSMGVTPLEGLVMGTRCGDLDPAVVLFLCRAGYSPDDVDKLLNKSSGLLGLAGTGSGDMRDIITAADGGNAGAKLALDVFVHRLQKYVGAYATVLNGFDALIFTGGIGENSARIRALVCEKLYYLGVEMDVARNRANEVVISRNATGPKVLAVPTNEELMIARETARLLM
ncbi:MAG: acetate kinase [Verrucomicrobia bacterium]|nr:MAG: acetate kinase [Verrucomicrobiota bacterium]